MRSLSLVLMVVVATIIGQGLGGSGWWGALAAALAALLWLAWDNTRRLRVITWLRGTLQEPIDMGGFEGEIMERVYKRFVGQQALAAEHAGRLQEFLQAIEASPNGITLLLGDGRIEWCNPAAMEHFGIDLQRDRLQYVQNLVRHPTFAEHFRAGQFDTEIEIEVGAALGRGETMLVLRVRAYGYGRLLLLSRDVTEVKRSERMRRNFIANVSHEIRTPLTVVRGFVESLQQFDLAKDEEQRYLSLIAQQASRMDTLVTDLLTLSKLEGSPMPSIGDWQPASVLFEEVLEDARSLATVLGYAMQRIVGDVPANLDVAIQPSEWRSAMANLLSNAVRYTPSDGQIAAGWRTTPDGGAEFYVQDSGVGIAAQHIPHLTERFYRVDQSRSRETGGTGLGLAIVKHVVQRHGGEVRIRSQLGKGSRFALYLPPRRVRTPSSASGPSVAKASIASHVD